MVPVTGLIRGVPELCVALALAMVVVVLGAKKLRLIGKRELEMLGSVPIPAVDKLLKFVSS